MHVSHIMQCKAIWTTLSINRIGQSPPVDALRSVLRTLPPRLFKIHEAVRSLLRWLYLSLGGAISGLVCALLCQVMLSHMRCISIVHVITSMSSVMSDTHVCVHIKILSDQFKAEQHPPSFLDLPPHCSSWAKQLPNWRWIAAVRTCLYSRSVECAVWRECLLWLCPVCS